jgi:mono/diheme cytochrome c family protein
MIWRWKMSIRHSVLILALISLALAGSACGKPNPQPAGLTAIPSLAPGATMTLLPEIPAQPGAATTPTNLGQADAASGAAVYMKNCTRCHGIEGQGVSAPALRNNEYIQTNEDQEIFNTIAGGVKFTEMPAWLQINGGSLTADRISSVVAYLHTLQGVSALPTSVPPVPEPTETALPAGAPTEQPARPSEQGGPGTAITLSGDSIRGASMFGEYCSPCHGPEGVQGVPNPGSDDGSVPGLKPIDPTLVNSDSKIFAENLDLFIEHGSVPEGPDPLIMMPPFGDSKMLTPQQIADLIAYVVQLNR